MPEAFFEQPVLNSPYEYPSRHWELDKDGQPTQKILPQRRRVDFVTPIPKAKKRKESADQGEFVMDEGRGLSSKEQQYQMADTINRLRDHADLLGARRQPPRTGRPLGLRRVHGRLGNAGRL